MPLPVYITFHVEPNELYLKQGQKPDWIGFEQGFELMERIREQSWFDQDIKFIWLVRADPQIDMVYGGASWGLKKYREQLKQLTAHADDLGIHVHPYRLQRDSYRWVQDFSDDEWLQHCISTAYESFSKEMHYEARCMSIGPNSTSTAIVNYCRELGIKYDFTPSHNGKKDFNQAPGEIKGAMNYYKSLPPYPYTPSREDIRKEDKASEDYYIIPVHYFMRDHGFMNIKGIAKKLLMGKSDYRKIKPSLSMQPRLFKDTFNLAQKRKLQYLLIDTRTHVFAQDRQRESIRENLRYLSELNGQHIEVRTPGGKGL